MEHDEAADDKKIAELEDHLRKTRDRKQARDDRAETAIRSKICFEQPQIVGLMMDDRLRSPSLLNPLNPLRLGWREGSLRPEGPILW